jgi:protein deglycase
MKKVAVHFATGFEEIEALAVVDVLRRAGISVTMVSVTDRRMVTGSHNITILADKVFDELDYDSLDMIVLPGGMPGAASLNDHSLLKEQILKFSNDGKALGAICAAPMVLGGLGLLDNKEAVCFPGFEKYLNNAKIVTSKVVRSGDIITAKGPGAAIDFGLAIVEMLEGEELANQIRQSMIAD